MGSQWIQITQTRRREFQKLKQSSDLAEENKMLVVRFNLRVRVMSMSQQNSSD